MIAGIHVANSSAQGSVIGQGGNVIGVEAWHAAGITGEGVKVGIWDYGFFDYQSLIGTELPPSSRLTAQGFGMPVEGTPEEIESDPEGLRHGTAVAEVVYDIAPDAEYFLMSTTTDDADMMEGLEWIMDQQVDVLVASISLPIHGCLDAANSTFEPIFEQMRDQGILFIVAAGNDRVAHWQGLFDDSDTDDLQNFTSDDNSINFEGFEGDPISLILSWDDPCLTSPNDFDLYVLDEFGEVVFSSDDNNAETGALETIDDVLPFDGIYEIVIEAFDVSGNIELDLVWVNGPELEHFVPEGSISFFEPAISDYAVAVASVNWETLEQEISSSQGPTKDGRQKPEITAPTCVYTVSYGGGPDISDDELCGFNGTSAATPHVGGAAVLIKQANPQFGPEDIQEYLQQNASDIGPAGRDNLFGHGLLRLPSP